MGVSGYGPSPTHPPPTSPGSISGLGFALPGPLMAAKARARVILYMLTGRPARGKVEGVARGEGQREMKACRWISGVVTEKKQELAGGDAKVVAHGGGTAGSGKGLG